MVTQLQSKITTHLLLPRRAFLSPWGTASHAQPQRRAARCFRDSSKKGEKYLTHTHTPAAGREAMRKSHSSHPVSPGATATHLHTQSRAALALALLSTHPRLSTAASGCSAGRTGR